MVRRIKFNPTAVEHYTALKNNSNNAALFEQVRKAIAYLEINPHHPSLPTHEFTSLSGANGEKVFEVSGAYRIFWHYGPDEIRARKRTPVITILAITRHP
jgi:hypothetical protein